MREVVYRKGMIVVNRERLYIFEDGNEGQPIPGDPVDTGILWVLGEQERGGWTLTSMEHGFVAMGCMEGIDFELPGMLDILGDRLENA